MVIVAPVWADAGNAAGAPFPTQPESDSGIETVVGDGHDATALLPPLLRAAGQYL
jgi:hypothetical protein